MSDIPDDQLKRGEQCAFALQVVASIVIGGFLAWAWSQQSVVGW